MNIEEAKRLAVKIVDIISPFCDKVEVAGSIRRQCPRVNDIDVVLIPKPFMWSTLINRLKYELDAKVEKAGSDLASLKVPFADQKGYVGLDLYVATPETWGVLLLIRTGSAAHNVKLCSWARNIGMQLSAAKGVIKDGRVIASRTEKEIYQALHLEYEPPEERE